MPRIWNDSGLRLARQALSDDALIASFCFDTTEKTSLGNDSKTAFRQDAVGRASNATESNRFKYDGDTPDTR